ncbi:hypothetical protein RGQ29_023845 [Quercus rubra]|uniref:Uncharacterized protein n=1 Tax=Quercus rubra TaxID=3512 RepID=A0AAN7IUN3_QUERU|nr:hypothetical protein RGQ29_023845 [Quercus rubra]
MGCGESKHDVVTDNTILRKKSDANSNSKNSKDIEIVTETNTKDSTTNSSVQKPEKVNKEDNNKEISGAIEAGDAKVIGENKAVKEGDDKEIDKGKEGGDEKQEGERFISHDSPNHYFSSRKDEEAVEGIISDAKSEYDSPHAAEKEDLLNENVKADNAVQEKLLANETNAEKKNGETLNVKEENVVKKAEPEATVKAKVSSPATEEKDKKAEEIKADIPTKVKDTK